ncbi:hypothetical protein PIROE2DRAFT_63174 [Piromyces sp. E2]|nr:hypothetical protein PIROE2DRAFT_63174 [Piromyces sp. E2]|eukprot:OUM60381.1 hypothetical protein PIROE2DRAFT_63174 [Piromyces sp. E2]
MKNFSILLLSSIIPLTFANESTESSEYSTENEDNEKNVRTVEDGIIYPNDPYLYFVGRWDADYVAQWAGCGFKLDFTGTSLKFVSGERSQSPIAIAYSLDYQTLQYMNVTTGENVIVSDLEDTEHNIQFYVTNTNPVFLQMERLRIDSGSKIHKYEPLEKYINVIGDSISAGSCDPHEAVDSWAFLLGKAMNVEADIIAQSGVPLRDISLYGNDHGMEYSYFMTSCPAAGMWGYISDEAYDFSKKKEPELIISFLGTNDYGDDAKVTPDQFLESLKNLITRIRKIYPNNKIAVASITKDDKEWNGIVSSIVDFDDKVYYIPTYEFYRNEAPYLYPSNYHPTELGQCNLLNGMMNAITEKIGFEKQVMPNNKWGMHGNISSGIEICDNPADDSIVYHYSYENAGGIGAW